MTFEASSGLVLEAQRFQCRYHGIEVDRLAALQLAQRSPKLAHAV